MDENLAQMVVDPDHPESVRDLFRVLVESGLKRMGDKDVSAVDGDSPFSLAASLLLMRNRLGEPEETEDYR
jgi:hypothetical protein